MQFREDERRLVARCLAGEAAAWETLWNDALPCLTAALRACRRDPSEIEELCQDLFARLWEDRRRILGGFEGRSSLARYLAVIVVRDAFRRSPPRALPFPGSLVDPAPGPEARAEISEGIGDLRRVVAGLPKREALLVRLVHGEGLEIREAARMLRLDAGHARVILHRARERLRRELSKQKGFVP